MRRSRDQPSSAWLWVGVLALAVGMSVVLVRKEEHKHASRGPSFTPAPAPQAIAEPQSKKPARVGVIRGTRLLQFGGRFTLSGTTPSVSGAVRVLGRWNTGHWKTFAIANADGHRFSFTFPLDHRGTLRIKIVQPDGYTSVGTYTVS